jgi:hypothetical protein
MASVLARIPLVGRFFQHVDPKPEDVVEFWKVMTEHFATKVVNKADSAEMKFVADALGLMKILDKDAFLKRYTTTIGDKIYIPFTIGEPHESWSLWSQITVCVHEHQHVFQDRAAGGLSFEWNYLTSSAKRAHYEAEAYRTNMVLEWRYQGRMLNPAHLAGLLKNYGCSDVDIAVVEKMLALSIKPIKAGAITSDVCRWGTIWLDARWKGR